MNDRMAEIISLGFRDACIRLNAFLVNPLMTRDGWIDGLGSTATELTRGVEKHGMGTYLEHYGYRLPCGTTLRLFIQSNGLVCNKFVSDGLNLHAHVNNIEVEVNGFHTNPMIPVSDDELLEAHTKVLMYMQSLLVRLELRQN